MVRSTWDSFGKDGSASRFAINRIVRIVPLYYIATLLALAWLTARGESFILQDLGLSLLFVSYHSEVEGALRPILGQGWTLNYEMFFYALFTLALVFGTSRRALVPPIAAFSIIVALGAMYRPLCLCIWHRGWNLCVAEVTVNGVGRPELAQPSPVRRTLRSLFRRIVLQLTVGDY